MPPSTSIAQPSGASAARRSTLPGDDSMKLCPPQPGLTVIASSRSQLAAAASTASTGVPGLIASPARQPASRIASRVRWACGSASWWMVMQSAPASANAATCSPGRSIIRCTSSAPPASWTRSAIAAAISGPIVIGGTNRPSITSTWIRRAPAAITSSTCAPSRAKSAARIDGAIRRVVNRSAGLMAVRSSDRPQHRMAAMLADHVRGTAHPHDCLVLAAVRALRDELVALEAEDAAEAAGKRCRPQPRLAAARTARARKGLLGAHDADLCVAMKKPSVRSRSGRVSASVQSAAATPEDSTTARFSAAEIVQVE